MLNLDTHVLLGALAGELTRREGELLAQEPWSIASIVLWEIGKLAELGRIEVDLDDPDFVRTLARVHVWPLTRCLPGNSDAGLPRRSGGRDHRRHQPRAPRPSGDEGQTHPEVSARPADPLISIIPSAPS